MKSFYSAFFLLVLSSTTAFGQISLVEADMAQVGDVIVRYIDTIPAYGPGSAGANQTWDFSQAVSEDTTVTTVEAPNTTAFASTFSGSNLAMQGGANSYLFFSQNSSQLVTDGAAGDLLANGDIIEAPFSDPLILHNFPRTFNDFSEDTYAFTTEADGSSFTPPVYRIKLIHEGHTFDTTDAYGTLITPTGTYDAIRVKTVDYTHDIIETQASQFLPFWLEVANVLDTTVSYSWHVKEEKLAIAEFSYDSIGNPKQFVYSAVPPVVTTGIADAESGAETFLYPQPATEQVCLGGSENGVAGFMATIYGVEGKMLLQQKLNGNCIELSGFKSGFYLLQLRNKEGILEETKRLVVQ